MIDFKTYLAQIGWTPTNRTREEWEFIHAQYRKIYQKDYITNYRKKFKRLELRYLFSEYERLEAVSQIYQVKPSRWVHDASLAYLESSIYLPPFPLLQASHQYIRSSANTINQLVQGAHIHKSLTEQQTLSHLVAQVQGMTEQLNSLYQAPKIIVSPLNLSADVA